MKVSAPLYAARAVPRSLRRAGRWLAEQLRQQLITRNRRVGIVLAVITVAVAIVAAHVSEWLVSPGVMILPILVGGLLLWPRALRVLMAIAAAGLVYDTVLHKAGPGIVITIVATAYFADVLSNTRGKLGTRGMRADRMMIELRDRIREQGTLPELGDGWGSVVVLRPAGGSSFGGDFVVSYSDGKTLEVALVDVSGKGMDAATRALLLSGAFGGVLGSVPREQFLPAANAYLRRGSTDEGFVTAVHLSIDLASGEYTLYSACRPACGQVRRQHGPVADLHRAWHRARRGPRPGGRPRCPRRGCTPPWRRDHALYRRHGRGTRAGHRRRHLAPAR